jgi:hypothetical protein
MSKKKKLKKMVRKLLAEAQAAQAAESGTGSAAGSTTGTAQNQSALGSGLLSSLGLSKLNLTQGQQFLLGSVIGAAATYVLTDEELRGKIMKAAVKLYSNMAGGFEELKEQMADLRAEAEAGQDIEGA